MPRNYDQMRDGEDHSFVIRGETFKLKRVRPAVLDQIDALQKEFVASEADSYADVVAFSEKRLLLLIDDSNGALPRWKVLRDRDDDPVTYGEIMDVSRWAFEEVTGLPTMPPAPSQPGRGSTAPTSKGA